MGPGLSEVARHRLSTPGNPRIDLSHYPDHPQQPDGSPKPPQPKGRNSEEKAFLALGPGAHSWLVEAAAIGAQRVRSKMTAALELAALVGVEPVDAALGVAAAAGRFAEGDLLAIVHHRANGASVAALVVADEGHSAQPGTSSWAAFGTRTELDTDVENQGGALMTTTATRRPGPGVTTTGTTSTAPALPEELLAVLKRMRLPYLRDAAPEVLATARAQRWDPAEVLRVLITEEIRGRDEATRRMRRKAAGLPAGKTFESWRETDSSIPPGTQTGLATLEWVGRAENLAIAGPSGTGKTHFVEALAHKVIDHGMRVSWFTLESLTAAIGRATVDGSVAKTIARITRAELIVIDDIGMLPAGQAAGEAFYRVVDAAYERRSIAVTSNLHPSGFDTIMPKTLATATVDRLLHHAHVVLTEGTSLRLSEATAGRGVMPLT
jgi:DNA replication protein DnaC